MMTNDPRAVSTLAEADYEAIEQAVMETSRGRWFLKEYAARNRHADTEQVLAAVARLESAVAGEGVMERVERVRHDLIAMARSIAGLKQELEASQRDQPSSSKIVQAATALDAIVHTTEQATGEILGATEAIQEIAWDLREQHFDEGVCDRIDRLATDIYTACTFQDLTAQRTQKVVQTLRFLEGRINGLIDAWENPGAMGETAAPAPTHHARPGELPTLGMLPTPHDLNQHDVDSVIIDGTVDFGTEAEPDIPPHVREAMVMHEAALDAAERTVAFAPSVHISDAVSADLAMSDLMATDEQIVLIDDEELNEVDLVEPDPVLAPAPAPQRRSPPVAPPAADDIIDLDDVVDELRPPAAVPMPAVAPPRPSKPSLAQIDAMPTTAKARLFG